MSVYDLLVQALASGVIVGILINLLNIALKERG